MTHPARRALTQAGMRSEIMAWAAQEGKSVSSGAADRLIDRLAAMPRSPVDEPPPALDAAAAPVASLAAHRRRRCSTRR